MAVIITNGAGYPLYRYEHNGTYWTLDGKQITEEEAKSIDI